MGKNISYRRNLIPTERKPSLKKGFLGRNPNLSVAFNPTVTSVINGMESILGSEHGYSVSKKGIAKGKTPFTDSTPHSLGRFLGKYDMSYEKITDAEGKPKYRFTTIYGDPDNPGVYHELWWDYMEEGAMRNAYQKAVKRGLEPLYRHATGANAQAAALALHEELMRGDASTEGGRRTHKQKRNRKQKTRKSRK